MTEDFKNLLHLFACAAVGSLPQERDYRFDRIFCLAKEQQIDTMVFLSVDKLKKQGNSKIDEALYQAWSNRFYSAMIFSSARGRYVSGFLKKLNAAGIQSCLLKGDALAQLYAEPDSRVSSDVDLWICDTAALDAACELLRRDGFTIYPNKNKSHQTECVHKDYGLIELHTDVCDRPAKTIWFENKITFSEDFLTVNDGYGGTFKTLSYTDGAVFVTFHFIKHFLSNGCGCRQMMDMLLYLKTYEKDIDWEVFGHVFGDLNYLRLIDLCKQIGNTYFQMKFDVAAPLDGELCEEILGDIERSGVFGQNEDFRKSFAVFYTRKRQKNSVDHTKTRMNHLFVRIVSFARRRKFNPVIMAKDVWKKNRERELLSKETSARLELFGRLGFFDGK